jgi:hypothetical protein
MSTLAETVEFSVSELERLTALGVISDELAQHLLSVMNISRTGRLFGHDSAVTYPKKILEMTEACSNLLNESGDNFEEVKEAVSKKFAGSRARKPTELNKIISSVVDEITHSHEPAVMNFSDSIKPNWFYSLFKR